MSVLTSHFSDRVFFPQNPDELSQRAADSLLDAPVAVFQFGREPNMRETSAREPEHSV